MMNAPANEPLDERLRQLLAVEQRLQGVVEAARREADLRLTAARADSQRRYDAAVSARARADDEQARLDAAAHSQTLASIEADHRAAIQALAAVPDTDVDAFARRAIQRALGAPGSTP